MDRRKFLKGVGAAVTAAVAPATAYERGVQTVPNVVPMTASEVLLRRAAHLRELEDKIREATLLPPEFFNDLAAYGSAALKTPDVKWFSLEVNDSE